MVFRHYYRKTLRNFAVLLELSSTLKFSRLFRCKRCAINKLDHFGQKKVSFGPKNFAKTCFLAFLRHYFRKTLRKLAVLIRMSSDLHSSRLLKLKSCANIKIDHFSSEKIKFRAKKRRKNGFFGVFRHYFRKTLRKKAVLLRLS